MLEMLIGRNAWGNATFDAEFVKKLARDVAFAPLIPSSLRENDIQTLKRCLDKRKYNRPTAKELLSSFSI